MLVTFVLGSVHAYSVFIVPLEVQLGLARSDVSLIYSLALVAITVAVLVGYRVYASLPSWLLVLLTCLGAALGLLLAADAQGWWQLCAGYSLVFGLCNGIGYGFCLQLVGRVMPARKGFAMGAVTAAYAVGSIVFAQVFAWLIESDSVAAALRTLALAVIVCGTIAALLLQRAAASYGSGVATPRRVRDGKPIARFWLAYMSAVFSGLMAIGHAAGIVLAKGSNLELATRGAIMIGVGSALGGFVSGWLLDRWPAPRFLVGLPLLAAVALIAVVLSGDPAVVVGLLSVVGFCYGAIIAIYPVAISNYFGADGPRAYGRVFTAWGFAGLVAPWMAGLIFDWRQAYELALVLAAAIALLSALSAALGRFDASA